MSNSQDSSGKDEVKIWMRYGENAEYRQALAIPINQCRDFAIHPLPWIRFVAYTVYGEEGHLSVSPGGQALDYTRSTLEAGEDLYYVSSQNPIWLDPKVMHDRSSLQDTEYTSCRAHFWEDVVARDRHCIITSASLYKACHLVPHAKGRAYMSNLSQYRFRNVMPPLVDIDDTRNGILLCRQLHPHLGNSNIAFLHTPNFAMENDDVGHTIQPNIDYLTLSPNKRLILQHFRPLDCASMLIAPHNSDVQQSDAHDWPPSEIFDLVYGSAVLKAWGVPGLMEFALKTTTHYYTKGINCGGPRKCQKNGGGKKQASRDDSIKLRAERARKRTQVREQQAGRCMYQQENLVPLVAALWDYRACQALEEAREVWKKQLQEDVLTWMSGVDEAFTAESGCGEDVNQGNEQVP